MAKRATVLGLALPPRDAGVPAHRWLSDCLRQEILAGRLAPGARLPATRDLARQFELSRGTIVSAFDQLKAEGYVDGRVGSGTHVRRVLPDALLAARGTPRASAAGGVSTERHLSRAAHRAEAFPNSETRPARAFRANLPALDLFPTTLWAQIAGRRARDARAHHLLGTSPLGYPPLRSAVAAYLRASRGVVCHADQVVIVSGVQEALDLVARLTIDRGDAVCMEEPGYIGAARVFDAHGARILPRPVDAEGMTLPTRARRVRLAYVTPAHQMPLGLIMSAGRRLQLLEWARQAGALVFEDDYDSEFRYAGRPLPALQGLDRHGLVLFAGSFSKTLFPALRVGYLVVPSDLVERVAAIKSIINRHAPVLEQTILREFIDDGHFGRHVRRMREVYAARREALMDGARVHLAGLLELPGLEAGLQTTGWLRSGIESAAAVAAAAARGVDVTSTNGMFRGPVTRQGLTLGFASPDPIEIARGVR